MDDPRAGKSCIPTPVHTEEEDQRVLALFAGLRVADVCDGMDKAGRRKLYARLGLPPDESVK